jgi:hypothetical protein
METIPALIVAAAVAIAAFAGGLKILSYLDESADTGGQANARQRVLELFHDDAK